VLLVAGVVAASLGVASNAIWTDSQDVDANVFSTGTIDISTNPTTALVTFTNMAPGDSTTQGLTVTNGGTLALRYAMTTAATNTDGKGLKDQLVLTIKTKTANPCSTFDGTQLYTGALSSGAIGNPAQGGQSGDRTLAASANEVLCFKVELPSSTGNAFQNATTTATFTFAAEQTANNP
jgi:predicted ribosomally synthesized peptide with SipW-like signal peptide